MRAVALACLLVALCLASPVAAAKGRAKKQKGGGGQRRPRDAGGSSCTGIDEPEEVFRVGMQVGRDGMYAESRACFELYVQMVPDEERGFSILAEVLARMSDYPASLEAATRAVELAPASPEPLFLKASALMGLHEYREAQHIFEHVLEIDPLHVNSMVNLGSLLGNLNDHETAADIYRRVLEIQPELWQAKHNLGTSLHSLKRFSEARGLLEEVYSENPGCFECAMSLANTLREAKDLSSSKAMYEDALAMNSGSKEAVLHLYTAMQELVDWDDLDIMFERVVSATQEQLAGGVLPTVSPYHSLLSQFGAPLMFQVAVAHADHARTKIKSLALDLPTPPLPSLLALPARGAERLRVGYIMADYRQHVTAHLLQTVFKRHDVQRVAAYAFALNRDDGGSFRRNIRESFALGRFVELFGKSDEEVATAINRDKIQVLIDIDYNKLRLSILALRPAALQCAWLAHPGTTGASFVDFLIKDQVVAPPEIAQPYVREAMVYMKHHYQINDHKASYPWTQPNRAKLRLEEGLPANATVLANFNSLYKLEPDAFSVWTESVLQHCGGGGKAGRSRRGQGGGMVAEEDGCVMWLVSDNDESNANLLRQAKERGIDRSRVILAERRNFGEHIRRAAAADLVADSYTYNAHTTAVDALYGGVPVVTVAGDMIQSRLAAGALGALGPGSESLARSRGEYAELLKLLLSRPAALQQLRRRMAYGGRRGLESRPLFDTEGWFRDFEGCLFLMADLVVHGGGAARNGEDTGGERGGGASPRKQARERRDAGVSPGAAQGLRAFHVVRAFQKEWAWPLRQL